MTSFVTVTLNPSLDISASVQQIVPVHKLRCSTPQHDPGGGGINVARVLRRWHHDVVAIYPIGGLTGQLLRRLVDNEGIRSAAIKTSGMTREDFTLFETDTHKEYRFVFPGARLDQEGWRGLCDAFCHEIPHSEFAIASGSLPPGVPDEAYAYLAHLAKEMDLRVAVDTSGSALRSALEEGVYLVKPNLRELSDLVARELRDEPSQFAACRHLVNSGSAEVVTLTLGAQGALAVTKEGAWRARAPSVEVASAVGAGDSFLAAMACKLASGESVKDSLKFAVAAGTAALISPGTELCRPSDVEQLVREVTIRDFIM